MNRQTSIAVVGSGPAGLATAWFLREQGYRQVTVLERDDRVGGKCDTVIVDGRPIDLGAFTVTPAYSETLKLAQALGARIEQQPPRFAWDMGSNRVVPVRKVITRDFGLIAVGWASFRYLVTQWRLRHLLDPAGFRGLAGSAEASELCGPVVDWMLDRGFMPLQDMFRMVLPDMGYGSFGETPTIYLLKYLNAGNFTTLAKYGLGIERAWPKRFSDGFGSLWALVARDLDVETGVDISAIVRDDRGAHVTAGGSTRTFDQIVLACPLDAIAKVLDCTPEEKTIFDRIKTRDYHVLVTRVTGVPHQIIDGVHHLEPGAPWEILQPWPGADVAVFYFSDPPDPNPDRLRENAARSLAAVYPGAGVGELVEHKRWAYFPHFDTNDLAAGIYDRLESLQGANRTAYTGGLLAFETVETVVEYSKALVARIFGEASA